MSAPTEVTKHSQPFYFFPLALIVYLSPQVEPQMLVDAALAQEGAVALFAPVWLDVRFPQDLV